MIALISQRNDKNEHGDLIDNLENNYINYLEKYGIKFIPVPNSTKNLFNYFQLPISLIILSGGNNIGESFKRDETEKKLLDFAISRKIPVFGICRGMQFINFYFKGKLINIKQETENKINHVAHNHIIYIINKKLKKLIGNRIEVNSYHNHGITIEGLSPELKPFSQTSDGIIEGIYHPFLSIIGIQWHPERKSPDEEANKKIIQAFLSKELRL